jgi:hypothetical protein
MFLIAGCQFPPPHVMQGPELIYVDAPIAMEPALRRIFINLPADGFKQDVGHVIFARIGRALQAGHVSLGKLPTRVRA